MSDRFASKKSDYVTVGKCQTTIRMPELLASDSNIGTVETLFDEENELGNNVKVCKLRYSKIETPQSVMCLPANHEQNNVVCTENFNQLRKFWEAKSVEKCSADLTVKIKGKYSMEVESETSIIEENEIHDSPIDVFSKRHKRRIQYVSTPVKNHHHQLALNYSSLVQNIAKKASSATKSSSELDESIVVSESHNEECVNDRGSDINSQEGDEMNSLKELDESASCLPNVIRNDFVHTSSENLSASTDRDLMPPPECEINKNSEEKKLATSLCNTPQSLGKGCLFRQKLFDSSEQSPISLMPSPSDSAKKGIGRKRHLMSLDSSKYSLLFSFGSECGSESKEIDKNVVQESNVECVSETEGFKCANMKTNETHFFYVNGGHSIGMDEVNGHDSRKELVSEKDSFFDITVHISGGKDSTLVDISNISAIQKSTCDSVSEKKSDWDDMDSPEVLGLNSGVEKNRKAVNMLTDSLITDTSSNESSCFPNDVATHVRDVIENIIPVLNEMSGNEETYAPGEPVNGSEKFGPSRPYMNTSDNDNYGDESLLFCAEHKTDLYSLDTDDDYSYFNESNCSNRSEESDSFVDLSSSYSDDDSSTGPLDVLVSPSLPPVVRSQTITVVTDNIEYVPQEDITSLDVPHSPAYLNSHLFEVSKDLKYLSVSVNTASRKTDLCSPVCVKVDKNTFSEAVSSSHKSICTESSQSVSDPQVVQKHVTYWSPTFDDLSDDSSCSDSSGSHFQSIDSSTSDFSPSDSSGRKGCSVYLLRRSCKRRRCLDFMFESDDDSSSDSYPPRSKIQKENIAKFEYPEVIKSTSVSDSIDAYGGFLSGSESSFEPLIKLDKFDESCFYDEEYPESLNSSSAYCNSFSFWSGSSSNLDSCDTWSHSSGFEEYLEFDETFPTNTQFTNSNENMGSYDNADYFSDLRLQIGTQIKTEKLSDVYKSEAPCVDLYNNSCSPELHVPLKNREMDEEQHFEPTDNIIEGNVVPENEVSAVHTSDVSYCQVPIDLSVNWSEYHQVSPSNEPNPDSEQNVRSAGYVSLSEAVHNITNESDEAYLNMHAPHIAVLENDRSQVWTEINIGSVAYSYEPSNKSIQYALDCYNNATVGMHQFPEHSVPSMPNKMVQSSVYSNFTSSAESSFDSIFSAYPWSVSPLRLPSAPSINNYDTTPLSSIAGLTVPIYASQSVMSKEVRQNDDSIKYLSTDIDQSIISVDQVKQSDCQYQPRTAQPNRHSNDRTLSNKVNVTATVDKDTDGKQGCGLIKYLETEVRNKLMSKKKAGSSTSGDKDTFILSEGLKDVRPYIISGWISSTYLMAVAKKADLVNEMLANPLNEKSEVCDWIIENCRSNTPAIFARDLFFRLFTLGELENLNLIKLARTKRFKALKKSVQRLFPGRVTSACWDGCLRLIKSSVSTLFKHRVRQVQDFLAIHAS